MRNTILNMLAQIEQENHVKIIYAVESGSRAWGFASPDSDYDVRYIYIRRTEEYLCVNERKDTIEGPVNDVLDFSGWDIRKTLELLRRTNPSLMESLLSAQKSSISAVKILFHEIHHQRIVKSYLLRIQVHLPF